MSSYLFYSLFLSSRYVTVMITTSAAYLKKRVIL